MSTNREILGKGGVVLGLGKQILQERESLRELIQHKNVPVGADDQLLIEASKALQYITGRYYRLFDENKAMEQKNQALLDAEATPEVLQFEQEAQLSYEECHKIYDEQTDKLNNMEISDTPTVYDPDAPMTRGTAMIILTRIDQYFRTQCDPDSLSAELTKRAQNIIDKITPKQLELYFRTLDAKTKVMDLESHKNEYSKLTYGFGSMDEYDAILNKHDTALVIKAEKLMQEYVNINAEMNESLIKDINDMSLQEINDEEKSLVDRMKQLEGRKKKLQIEEKYNQKLETIFTSSRNRDTSTELKGALNLATQDIQGLLKDLEKEDLQPKDIAAIKEMILTKFEEFSFEIKAKISDLTFKEVNTMLETASAPKKPAKRKK